MKIFNDPVHGFIELRSELLLRLLDHPWVQRLRRIKQMGASSLVYPGAEHTRLNHALGAYHLAQQALATLQANGTAISADEAEATLAAVLLHDLGHGPFSHALEGVLVPGQTHEAIGLVLTEQLSAQVGGALELALSIARGRYHRPFLHELVASQLDVDRLDYLLRDSFFTGVAEGVIGADRILKTLAVEGDRLVVHEKGLHSVEKFLVARRLMYWQVYFHKTAQAAEGHLLQIIARARRYRRSGGQLEASPALQHCLALPEAAPLDAATLDAFTALDDHDVYAALKAWAHGPDQVLTDLCRRWRDRVLFKLRYYDGEVPADDEARARAAAQARLGLSDEALPHYVFTGRVSNRPYGGLAEAAPILIRRKRGGLVPLQQISDLAAWPGLEQPRRRAYLCAPAESWAD